MAEMLSPIKEKEMQRNMIVNTEHMSPNDDDDDDNLNSMNDQNIVNSHSFYQKARKILQHYLFY